jgi:hypothetical protein
VVEDQPPVVLVPPQQEAQNIAVNAPNVPSAPESVEEEVTAAPPSIEPEVAHIVGPNPNATMSLLPLLQI